MVTAQMPGITWWTLLQVVFRSFWLQSCWNFQGMQNLGFGFAMIPVIKSLYLAKRERAQALKRHVEFFNTHPYCAAIILGVVIKMEAEGVESSALDKDQVSRIKTGMMGPLAALGDTVFWATLRPVLALCGVALIFSAQPGHLNYMIAGLWLFIILYSLPHLILRFGGVFLGFHRGIHIVQDLRRFNPQLIARKLTLYLSLVAGGIFIIYPFKETERGMAVAISHGMIFLGLTALLVLAIKRGITISKLIYGIILFSLLLALTGWEL